MKTAKQPTLRFFPNKLWEEVKMNELVSRASNPINVEAEVLYRQIGIRSHGKGLFHKEAVSGTELGNKRVFWVVENALIMNIVFAWEQAVAKTTERERGMIASHRFPMYLAKEDKATIDFLLLSLLTPKGKTLLELASPGGAGRNKTLGQAEFEKIKLSIPSLPEQQKIASFFTAIDRKLALLRRKVEALERYKRGAMAAVFSQRVRFRHEGGKEFGEWEEKKLEEIAVRVKSKNSYNNQNVLTISAQDGLISQLEFFNKSVAGKNLSTYYLLKRDDFAYNKSYSNGYPFGAIKRLTRYPEGVVSTLYICFRLKEAASADFMEQYFNAGEQNREIEKVAQEGARNHGLLNIGVEDFFNITVRIPSLKEQARIASFFSAIDAKIAHTQQQLEKLTEWKKGLLQRMFV